MKYNNNLLLLAGMVLAGGVCSDSAAANAPTKRNVLFLVVDDLRPELGCYGKDYIKSPNIDSLAKSGVVFNRAYCQQSVCSPSRSSVMTGMRPDTTKVWDLVTSFRDALPDVVTLGQQFKTNGYFVQGMGKIYHGGLNDPATWSVPWQDPKAPVYALPADAELAGKNVEPVDEDGSNNKGTSPNAYSLPPTNEVNPATPVIASTELAGKKKGKKKKAADGTQGTSDGGKANSRGPIYECADVPDNFFEDGKTADLAVKTLADISQKSEPFFLAIGFRKPHLPWVAPKKYWDLYDPAKIQLAPNQFLPIDAPEYAVLPNDGEVRAYKGVPPSGPIPLEIQHKLKQAYFAGVSYSDAQIGRVLAELDRLNLRTNTIIVLWGDHGWKLGEHMAWGKHSNVENDVNAPLIFAAPGIKSAGAHSDALVEFVDIYPTLCDLAGISKPNTLEGTTLKPLLDNPNIAWKSAAFSQYPRNAGKTGVGKLMGYTMRTDRYRFTIWVNNNDHAKFEATELYDHQTDSQENYNLAKKPENAELVAKLIDQWKRGWRGAMPIAAEK